MVGVRTVVLNLLVIGTLLVSGCADVGTEPTMEVDHSDHDHHNETLEGNLTVPSLTAMAFVLVDGNVTEMLNGTYTVPADSNVTFDATNSTGNITMFTWTVGNETVDGPTATFMFPAGNHSVLLTAFGHDNATANVTIPINATSMGPALPVFQEMTTFTMSQAATTVHISCVTKDGSWDFPADYNGVASSTQRVKMTLDPSWTGVAINMRWHMHLIDADGNTIMQATKSSGSDNLVIENAELDLPGGTYTVRGQICAANGVVPQGSYVITAEADHYA